LKIAIDAMGGDHAPDAVIAGVIKGLDVSEANIVLIGIQECIEAELKKYKYPAERIEVIHAPEVVEMKEHATVSLRKKKDSSISRGILMLKERKFDAFISAGNTGAVVAASTINLGMLEGVERPAIGIALPTLRDFTFLIDCGANTDPKPQHLLQSAKMAAVYTHHVLGVKKPTIGLLNIGEESSKGGEFEKEIHKLMEEQVDNFIGNVEASEVFTGKCDCIISDGFIGNVVIKVSEGLMEAASALMRREIKKSPLAIVGSWIMKSRLQHIKKYADYTEYGGAPLLGVDGLVMIGHGRSDAKAIKNAILATTREVKHNIIEKMVEEISATHQPS